MSSNASKSTYIPPHLRKEKTQQSQSQTQQSQSQKTQLKPNKPKIDEFPVLAPVQAQKQSTMDFKELFARRKEVKKRQKKMKYGWVRLTKNGMIDSLSPEEREQSNLEINERRMEHAMIDLAYRIERDTERRVHFENLEPIVLEDYSSEESYVSSEESYVDEDEEGYESK
jgi:DNA primase large subunit